MRLTLAEMGHAHPPTLIQTDNATANSIANGTIKHQCSRAMDMRFFWIADQADQRNFKVLWAPGQENLGDYSTKHHLVAHHRIVHPFYLHTPQSPRYLQRALAPSVLRGCVDTSTKRYVPISPLKGLVQPKTLVPTNHQPCRRSQ